MDTRTLSCLSILAATAFAASPVYRVSVSGGTHATLQAAIDDCPSGGCRIELTDSVYRFAEPVSIRGKADIQIVGVARDGKRPILTLDPSSLELAPIPSIGGHAPSNLYPVAWSPATPTPFQNADGTTTILSLGVARGAAGMAAKFFLHPGRTAGGGVDPLRPAGWVLTPFNVAHYSDSASSGDVLDGYLHAGLLQIDGSRRIAVTGIDFDGGVPTEVLTSGLWNGMYDQLTGIAAIGLNNDLQATVSDCEFHGWSEGIRIVDRNPGGLVTDLMASEPVWNADGIKPLANPGAMGGHRIESNLAHGNHLFVHLESSWDLASSIRFNKAWDNGSSRLVASVDPYLQSGGEWSNRAGGFAFLMDVVYPSNKFQGNTSVRNTQELGWAGWRASQSQLYFDNVSQRQDRVNWTELSLNLGRNSRNNWVAASRYSTDYWNQTKDSVVPFCANSACEPLTPAWGAKVIDDSVAGRGYFGDDLGAVWQNGRTPESIQLQDQTLGFVSRSNAGWNVTLPVPVEALGAIASMRLVKAFAQRIVLETQQPSFSPDTTPLMALPMLEGREILPGVNFLQFEIPASSNDSIWRVEMAVEGFDGNTGEKVHSNLGTWLVRPLGKQLQVVLTDTGIVNPGQTVEFAVQVKDSLGLPSSVTQVPQINAEGWNLVTGALRGVAARKASASSSFRLQAVAPSVPGLSQVVFWSAESGRTQAIPGAAYVQVGARSSGIANRKPDGNWRISGVSRRDGGWYLDLQGVDAATIATAELRDAQGRGRKVESFATGGRMGLRLPRLSTGTYFLSLAGRTRAVSLVP